MGDRANVFVHSGDRPGVYLYTHWSGTELPEALRRALANRERWFDDQYLARIILDEMTAGRESVFTGYGISAYCGDGENRILDVDTDKQIVTMKINQKPTQSWPFQVYASWGETLEWDEG